MTSILIIESNTPDILARGKSGAVPFVRALQGLAPEARIVVECPYAAPLREGAMDGIDGVIFSGSGVAWATDAEDAGAFGLGGMSGESQERKAHNLFTVSRRRRRSSTN